MKRARKFLWATIALVALALVVIPLVLSGPSMQRPIAYPQPHGLPPVVNQTTEQLLARLQAVLETSAPLVAASLQPGLSDAQISTLESQGGFQLCGDLRALYRWHDGIGTKSTVGLLAGQRLVPLEEVVRQRALVGQQVASGSGAEGAAFSAFAGHRKGWIQILDDGAGDGYFYDPKRADAEGSFFYHFAQGDSYLWFPSFRNFLAGVIECYESQSVRIAADGKHLNEDFDRTQKIWERFAKSSE